MFNFSGPALVATLIVSLAIALFLLTFSSRDTVQGFREVWDISVFRRLIRRFKRFSLKSFLITTTLAAPLLAVLTFLGKKEGWGAVVVWCVVGGYVLAAIVPMLFIFYRDAFGPSPRAYWRKRLQQRDWNRHY